MFERPHKLENSIKSDRTESDVVYEVMLKTGIPLDCPVKEIQINDKKVYSIGDDSQVFVCVDYGKDGIKPEDVEEICKFSPEKIVLAQQAFEDDVDLSNAYYLLKDRDILIELL